MKILVTGGSGYIGSHTVVELQQQGHDVFIIDNLSNSDARIVNRIKAITGIEPHFEKIDLCDFVTLESYFEANVPFDGVIHFAAFKAVGESKLNPLKYYRNNLMSTINLLNCMQKHNCRNLVFSSSCTVYGQPDILPVNEEASDQKAMSPYGITKQVSEKMIADISNSTNINAISLRYFNPIGAHESALIGELPIGTPNNLLPFITQTAIGKRDFLSIFGNDYNTPDGTCIRDYIHVVDIAKAHIVALERLTGFLNKRKYEVFNLGTGNGYSVMEVVKSFEKVSGKKLNYHITDRRSGDIEKVWSDSRLANEELGWKALLNLDEMTLSAWKWELALATDD